jgi:hypothetical protein
MNAWWEQHIHKFAYIFLLHWERESDFNYFTLSLNWTFTIFLKRLTIQKIGIQHKYMGHKDLQLWSETLFWYGEYLTEHKEK